MGDFETRLSELEKDLIFFRNFVLLKATGRDLTSEYNAAEDDGELMMDPPDHRIAGARKKSSGKKRRRRGSKTRRRAR